MRHTDAHQPLSGQLAALQAQGTRPTAAIRTRIKKLKQGLFAKLLFEIHGKKGLIAELDLTKGGLHARSAELSHRSDRGR